MQWRWFIYLPAFLLTGGYGSKSPPPPPAPPPAGDRERWDGQEWPAPVAA